MSELHDNRPEFALVGEVLTKMQKACERSAVSIVGLHTEAPRPEGSGTIVETEGDVVLLTAEHVVREVRTGYSGLAFSQGDGKEYGRFHGWFMRDKDELADIAFAIIPRPVEPDSGLVACPQRVLARSAEYSENDLFFFYGFPGKGSRFSALANGMLTRPLPYAGKPAKSDDGIFDAAIHLGISFDTCIGIDGKSSDLPDPRGLSGSAVWRIPWKTNFCTWSPEDAQIIGVNIRFDPQARCLIATRIERILTLLRVRPIVFD